MKLDKDTLESTIRRALSKIARTQASVLSKTDKADEKLIEAGYNADVAAIKLNTAQKNKLAKLFLDQRGRTINMSDVLTPAQFKRWQKLLTDRDGKYSKMRTRDNNFRHKADDTIDLMLADLAVADRFVTADLFNRMKKHDFSKVWKA